MSSRVAGSLVESVGGPVKFLSVTSPKEYEDLVIRFGLILRILLIVSNLCMMLPF
jgi:hypothetical protein